MQVNSDTTKNFNKNIKSNYDSYLSEFKGKKENIINILKIVIEQKKIEEFKKVLEIKFKENSDMMREFIRTKYFFFVKSIDNINDMKTVSSITEEVLLQLEDKIQVKK